MKNLLPLDDEYLALLRQIKSVIRSTQIKTALAVNQGLIGLYWEIGKMIVREQETKGWGSAVVERLAVDLKMEFPDMGGFSRIQLFFFRRLYLFYKDADEKVLQLVKQIPWGHNILIFRKSKSLEEALFYLMAAFDNNWSRNILDLQLESNLYARQGKSITNFHSTLPKPQADLANELLKDPYIFDFLTLENEVQELELERQLTQYITKFLLELGAGFAFVGRQYPLEIGNKEYVFDLLFYHLKLRCFVVIDLKMREFEPEHAGKMNFYLSAADDLLKTTLDEPSIGIILCRSKNKIEVEYALRDLNKPIGVSEFILSHHLPDNLRSNLPTVEQIQEEMERRLAELDL